MERLTKRTEQGDAYIPECFGRCEGEGPSEKCRECDIEHNLIYSLAAYEDTDLTPEQISILDKLFLAKCEEVNQLRAELERLKGKPSDTQGDLIRRQQATDALRVYADQKGVNGEVELANGILKAVCFLEKESNVPTAYDLEKVVEQMEEYAKSSICYSHDGCPYRDDDSIRCENCGALGALEIVRKGGKE